MGTKERKEREKEHRRKVILEAAVELISENGFDQVTMEEIAKKAEFSKGALYLYFKDKHSLYIEIKRQAIGELSQEFLNVLQLDESGATLLKKMAVRYLRFLKTNPIYTQSFMHPEIAMTKDDHIRDQGKELITLITHAIKIGLQDGSIKSKVNPKLLAIQIGWCMFGVLQFFISDSASQFRETLHDNGTDLKTLVRQFIDVLIIDNQHHIKITT